MDFDFSDDQYLFRDTVRSYLSKRFVGPKPSAPRPGRETVDQLWAGLTELGIFSLLVPEEFGGLGLSFVDLSLILEEFGRALVPSTVIDTPIATDALVRFGSEEQKSELLPAIAEGRMRIAIAVTEPDAGYELDDINTAISRSARDSKLNGKKILVADAARADKLLVVCRSGQTAGLGLLLLDAKAVGIGLREHETLDPSGAYHEVDFEDVAVAPRDILIPGQSAAAAQRVLDVAALTAATLMTGISGAVFDATVEYVKQRNQFGKPLGSFQAIKHRCADMMVSLDSSRSAAYYAAWALVNGAADQAKAVSIAKSFCGDSSRFICDQGTQLHGGMGFTWELGLHFFLRRAKMLEYAYGDATFHRKRVLAETLAELRMET
jgi:alkylation response protein AidB-like acyl-CoA dehydrogenase